MKRVFMYLTAALAVALLATSCATVPGGGGDGQLSVGIVQESEVEHADIFLDGRMLCTVYRGEDYRDFDMPTGTYRMRIVANGYEEWERTIQVVGGTDYQEVHVRLERLIAFVLDLCEWMPV